MASGGVTQYPEQPAPPPAMKTSTKNCFLRSEPLASAKATIMKNNLTIDNPLNIRSMAAAKWPTLHTHAGNGGYKVVLLGLDE